MIEKGLKPVIYEKDKGVSPIIATILLVAITVILASTLYLALGGFFSHTTTATPTVAIGSTNTTTSPITAIETAATSTVSDTYSITIGSVSSSTVPWTSTDWVVTTIQGPVTLTYVSATTGWQAALTTGTLTGYTFTLGLPTGTYVGSGQSLTLTITVTGATSAVVGPQSLQFMDTSSSGGGQMGSTAL